MALALAATCVAKRSERQARAMVMAEDLMVGRAGEEEGMGL
jgi:hypothetical protein